jgi:hypothetical protein
MALRLSGSGQSPLARRLSDLSFSAGGLGLPLPLVLRKIFELNTLGPDLGELSAGLNVTVRLVPDW